MKPLGTLLAVAGGILAGIGLIWGVVIGFYPSEVPALLGTLGSGALLLFIGSRMVASTKPTQVEWRPTAPPAPGAASSPIASVLPDAAAAPAEVAAAQPSPPAPERVSSEQLDDSTVAVPRRRRRVSWSLQLPDGSTALVREQALLGRAPQPTAEHPRADLIVIDDPSVSKTHALLRLADGALQVLDLDSSNGTVLIVDDVEQSCPSGVWMLVPDGAALELGTVELRCSAVASREVAS